MSSFLDIIGSIIIAGMLLINFALFMDSKQESDIEANNKVMMQGDMRDVATTMMHDLRKIGFGCDTLAIIKSLPTVLAFRGDIDNDSKVDTVVWWYGIKAVAVGATAKNQLFRVMNSASKTGFDMGVNSFVFTYLDKDNLSTTTPSDVRSIQVDLDLREPIVVAGKTYHSEFSFNITPKNL